MVSLCRSLHTCWGLYLFLFCSCRSPGVHNIRILVERSFLVIVFFLNCLMAEDDHLAPHSFHDSWQPYWLRQSEVLGVWLSFLTIIGSTVFRCLVYSLSFICLLEGVIVVVDWHTFPGSRHLTKYCADSGSECSLTFCISVSVCRWSILDILWQPVAILRASFCVYLIFL